METLKCGEWVRKANKIRIGEDGKPIISGRMQETLNPYNFDPYMEWVRVEDGKEVTTELYGGSYSDRIFSWNHKKHDELCHKHFGNRGQYWSDREPEKIEAFLRDYFDRPLLKLMYVEKHCHLASGYPVWLFGYNNED